MKGDKINKRRLKRIPLLRDEPSNLAEIFLYAKNNHPRPDALNYKRNGNWEKIATDEMLELIESISHSFAELGLKRGDRVAILSRNSPMWTIADAACQFAGIIDVPIYTTLTPDSVKYILNDCGARIIFVENRKTLEGILEIIPDCAEIEHVILFEDDPVAQNEKSISDLIGIGRGLKETNKEWIKDSIAAIEPDDVATLIYTSGTTGEPKGVMLTHENLVSNIIDAGEKYRFSERDVCLSVLPLSHVFERTGMYLYIFSGMKVFYAESMEKIPDNLAQVKPTIFVGVPRMFEKVYQQAKLVAANQSSLKERIFDWAIEVGKKHARFEAEKRAISATLAVKHSIADKLVFTKLRAFFGGRLRFCITGGAALSDSIYLIFTGADIKIMQGYGMTETSPVITSNNPIDFRLGTVGKPIRNVEVKIAEDGEVLVSGPNVMVGYFNKPEETRKTFDENGWLQTGDIGELDELGYLKITDRKKELFKTSGGKYIAPSPIEQMIKGSRFVNQVILIGNGRKFATAMIVPNFEQLKNYLDTNSIDSTDKEFVCKNPSVNKLFESEVEKYCVGLAQFETVKRIILIPDEFTIENGELTPTLKLKRRIIDEHYDKQINELYEAVEKEKPRN